MAIGVSQDLCSGLCHATHSSDNPERGWDGEMTKFAPKQSLSLHMLGTKPQKMPSGFYSNLQRHQKWGKLLDGCGRLTVALAYNEGERSTHLVETDSKFQLVFSANLSVSLTDRYSCCHIHDTLKYIPN